MCKRHRQGSESIDEIVYRLIDPTYTWISCKSTIDHIIIIFHSPYYIWSLATLTLRGNLNLL